MKKRKRVKKRNRKRRRVRKRKRRRLRKRKRERVSKKEIEKKSERAICLYGIYCITVPILSQIKETNEYMEAPSMMRLRRHRRHDKTPLHQPCEFIINKHNCNFNIASAPSMDGDSWQ